MKLSNPEKLILVMLSDIYESLDIKNGVDPEFIREAIYTDNTWGLEWRYTGIFESSEETPPLVRETCDILNMWSMIELSYERFGKEDRERIKVEAEPFGEFVKFRGFDGNYEGEHMSIANFLVNQLERFQKFKGRDLNAHMPSVETYMRMVEVFDPIFRSLGGNTLNPSQVIAVLKAAAHSEYRNT